MNRILKTFIVLLVCMAFVLACNLTSLSEKGTGSEPDATVGTDVSPVVSPLSEQPTLAPTAEAAPTEAPSPASIVHLTIPEEKFPGSPQVIHDQESIRNAAQKEAYGGDEFYKGRYERPFDRDMNYIPTIDIKQANLFRDKDNEFIFAVIQLMEDPSLQPEAEYGFGIELDVDLDGRGDVLIWTRRPLTKEWSVEGVTVWGDSNKNIGGKTPMRDDPPPGGDGYELKIFDSGVGTDPDLAWSRVSPQDPHLYRNCLQKSGIERFASFSVGSLVYAWGRSV